MAAVPADKAPPRDVDHYLERFEEPWLSVLCELRRHCTTHLVGYDEDIAYKMPAYLRDGVVDVAFAKQTRYLSFYLLKHEVLESHRDLLVGLNMGKGCIRFARPEALDFSLIDSLLVATVASTEPPC